MPAPASTTAVFLHETLRLALRQARQARRPMAVVRFDLDHFRAVSDTHGEAAADLVLRTCASVASVVVGSGPDAPTLGRLGGDAFLVLLPGATLGMAHDLAERLRLAVAAHPLVLPAGPSRAQAVGAHRQTVSAGVAEWTSAMLEPADLLDAADRRLSEARNAGGDRVSR